MPVKQQKPHKGRAPARSPNARPKPKERHVGAGIAPVAPRDEPGDVHSIADLHHDPKNCRKHNPRNIGSIVNALHKVGAARSIVIDEHNMILAGNGLIEAAGEAGIENVRVIEADGNTIIAVRRVGLTDKQKAELAIADNRTAELAEWDAEQLLATLAEYEIDAASLDFTDEDLARINADAPAPEVTEDEAPDASTVPARCSPGDLWQLGEHRLLCGDSTKAEDVERLLGEAVPFIMVTDPPYGVEYDPEWRQEAADKGLIGFSPARMGTVTNDERADWTESYALFPGHVAYVWHAGVNAGIVAANLDVAKFKVRSQIIWKKSSFAISRGHYHWQHEPAWYAVRPNGSAKWCGDRSQSTTWEISSQVDKDDNTNHGTQKPVECMARPIRNHGGKDDHVYDPFLGSGTTLIAAEQLGRRCFGIEISPTYCDVILARWEKLTGKAAERVDG